MCCFLKSSLVVDLLFRNLSDATVRHNMGLYFNFKGHGPTCSRVSSNQQKNYGRRSATQKGLLNRFPITLRQKHCSGVSRRRYACSNASPSPGSSSSLLSSSVPRSQSKPLLTRHSLHLPSKLSPSIQMIRLCNTMQTQAHMMMIMWHLVLTNWIRISFND